MVLDCNSAALFLKQILERVTEEDLILFLSLQQWSQHFLPLKKGFRLILELTHKKSLSLSCFVFTLQRIIFRHFLHRLLFDLACWLACWLAS